MFSLILFISTIYYHHFIYYHHLKIKQKDQIVTIINLIKFYYFNDDNIIHKLRIKSGRNDKIQLESFMQNQITFKPVNWNTGKFKHLFNQNTFSSSRSHYPTLEGLWSIVTPA